MAGKQSIKIAVARHRFHVKEQRLSLQVDLGPKDRFDAGVFCRQYKFNRAMQIPGVGERDSGHSMFFGEAHNRGRSERGIQKRIMAVDPQRDVITHGLWPGSGLLDCWRWWCRRNRRHQFLRSLPKAKIMTPQNYRMPSS